METAEYELMDEAEGSMWWYRALHTRLLKSLLPVRGRLLDAGCGTGGFLEVLRSRRPDLEAVGLDFNESAVRRAAEKSGSHVVLGSVNSIPFPSGSFDAIVSADVLCHEAVQPLVALAEFLRLLRPDGLLVINMPALEWLRSAHDRRVLTARRVTKSSLTAMLMQTGFGQVHARYWNTLLLPLMVMRRKLIARDAHAPSDVAPFSPWLNTTLHTVTALEQRLALPMPAGGSVLATAVALPQAIAIRVERSGTDQEKSD
jgi:ubiquinone/menaquinone biosynthesis C-methylase UbiE